MGLPHGAFPCAPLACYPKNDRRRVWVSLSPYPLERICHGAPVLPPEEKGIRKARAHRGVTAKDAGDRDQEKKERHLTQGRSEYGHNYLNTVRNYEKMIGQKREKAKKASQKGEIFAILLTPPPRLWYDTGVARRCTQVAEEISLEN